MINGRFIKTGRIESADGTTYFDLDNSEIGGRIVFTSNGQEKTLEELGNEALESKNFINNTLPGLLAEIQAQLDGQIEQFFETYDPTLNNAPASEWTTTQLKDNHLGDLFYNTATGAVFRFVKENGVYKWSELSDAEVAQAIALAMMRFRLQRKRTAYLRQHLTPLMKSAICGFKVQPGILCVALEQGCPAIIRQVIGKRQANTPITRH